MVRAGAKETWCQDFSTQGKGLGAWLEENFPAAETMSEIHDALVDFLTDHGVPDWLANIPTMPGCYDLAVRMEILNSLKDLFNKDKETGGKKE